jgi:hypothetical protein
MDNSDSTDLRRGFYRRRKERRLIEAVEAETEVTEGVFNGKVLPVVCRERVDDLEISKSCLFERSKPCGAEFDLRAAVGHVK